MKNELFFFKPDLILLDVILNGENGRDICEKIRANKTKIRIPIILISANPDWLENCKECGADDILEKPFDIKNLTLKIDHLLLENVAHYESNKI